MSLWKQLSAPRSPPPEVNDDIDSNDEIDMNNLSAEEKHLYMLTEFNDLFENSDEDEYFYCQCCKIKFRTEEEAVAHQETPEHFAAEEGWEQERSKFVKELKAERDEYRRQKKEDRAWRRKKVEQATAAKKKSMREWREKRHEIQNREKRRW